MRLRKLRMEDAPLMLEWMHDESVVSNLQTDFLSKTIGDCENFINHAQNCSSDMHLAIVNHCDEYLGTVSLKHIDNYSAEFAITIRKSAMGRGIAGWAMKEIIDYGFKVKHLQLIYWCINPENIRGIRFYDKNGYCKIPAPQMVQGYTSEQVEQYLWYGIQRSDYDIADDNTNPTESSVDDITSNVHIKKLYKCIKKYYNKNNEIVLEAISALGEIYYKWNQFYTDNDLEDLLEALTVNIMSEKTGKMEADEKTVLFYDAFGNDTRGLALIYLKALAKLGYKIIYVSVEEFKDEQPTIHEALKGADVEYRYIKKRQNLLDRISLLYDIFIETCPKYAFLYTVPNDVAGIIVFQYFRNTVKRFQINLTDHAFWLGKNAFDICIEFRPYGASVSHHYRGIPLDKITCLPYYPYIDKNNPFEGFPFETTEETKVLFSGGSLYKTIDETNTYYKIVEKILEGNNNVIFLYAGKGDSSRLTKLQEKFPKRVHHIPERKDLYQVLEHSDLYLNTYPMGGGLMMQYAAAAGKIPVTLTHDQDIEGILIEQQNRQIEYEDAESLIADALKLLSDAEYLKKRTALLHNSVPTEEIFTDKLGRILETDVCELYNHIEKIDTEAFRYDYKARFNNQELRSSIIKRYHKKLWIHFPRLFIESIILDAAYNQN